MKGDVNRSVLIGQLIKILRERKGLRQKDLAEYLGVTKTTLHKYEHGVTKNIPWEKLKKLSELLDVNVNVFYEANSVDDYKKYLKETKQDNLFYPDTYHNVELIPLKEYKQAVVPVYGSVPAGKPVEAFQNKLEDIVVMLDPRHADKPYFGLEVHGDSMYPNYMEGDIVIVEATSDFNSGDDVVAYVGYDFESTLKRIHRRGDKIILEPLNKEYRQRVFTKDSDASERLTVVGVVRQLIRGKL